MPGCALKQIILARRNGFFELRGTKGEQGWTSKVNLPGSKQCRISEEEPADLTCFFEPPARWNYPSVRERVRSSLPSGWTSEEKNGQYDIRFYAGPAGDPRAVDILFFDGWHLWVTVNAPKR